jgi:hypothetical protein
VVRCVIGIALAYLLLVHITDFSCKFLKRLSFCSLLHFYMLSPSYLDYPLPDRFTFKRIIFVIIFPSLLRQKLRTNTIQSCLI